MGFTLPFEIHCPVESCEYIAIKHARFSSGEENYPHLTKEETDSLESILRDEHPIHPERA